MTIKPLFNLIIITLFYSTQGWACKAPSKSELSRFFEGSRQWTEVESPSSLYIATRNPIFLNLDFNHPESTTAIWGNHSIAGEDVEVCKGTNSASIVISHQGRKLTFTKLSRGVIRSQIPLVGNYYYRPSSQVQANLLRSSYENEENFVESDVAI
jgi:hypothetical protein